MSVDLSSVKVGLAIVLLGLFLNLALGISFGMNEDMYKDYVAAGVAANPGVHDSASEGKIWRYAQRTHFHAGGIAAYSLGLIILIVLSNMSAGMQRITAILIGLSSIYPLAWLSKFLLAPSIGRAAADEHFLTSTFVYIGVAGLLFGSLVLVGNLFLGLFKDK